MKFKPFRHPFRFFRILRFVWKARKPSTVHDMPAVVENPYRCHHVRRPKHVAHQRRYWRSSTLCASEWVRHWYARLSRVGLIATVQSAWSDTNNFQCFAVFLLMCFYVYMYTYTHSLLQAYLPCCQVQCPYKGSRWKVRPRHLRGWLSWSDGERMICQYHDVRKAKENQTIDVTAWFLMLLTASFSFVFRCFLPLGTPTENRTRN